MSAGRNVPPEAAAMMKGLTMSMDGSIWVAKDVPGASEYMAFQKAGLERDMAAAAMGASGMNIPGMEKLMKAMSGAEGLAYLTEMTMTIDGTGQMADMMKQMGADEDHEQGELHQQRPRSRTISSRCPTVTRSSSSSAARPIMPRMNRQHAPRGPCGRLVRFDAPAQAPASRSNRRRRCRAWSPKSRPPTRTSRTTSSRPPSSSRTTS